MMAMELRGGAVEPALVRDYIDRVGQGGSIVARDNPGGGAVIEFTLPSPD